MKDQNSYKIIFEDQDLIIINKSAGLLSIPDRYDPNLPNLKTLLEKKYGKIFVAHRLDKDTSGITVFAKNENSHRELSIGFEKAKIERIYHAFVNGTFSEEPIEIDIPVMADPSKKGRSIPSAMGKSALTKVKLIENYGSFSKVACKLETGRHHQIRVHLASLDHPLIVDNFYGEREEFFVSEVKKNYNLKKETDERPLVTRNTLHAFSLRFKHPTSDQELYYEADYPKDLVALGRILSKYNKHFK